MPVVAGAPDVDNVAEEQVGRPAVADDCNHFPCVRYKKDQQKAYWACNVAVVAVDDMQGPNPFCGSPRIRA